MCEKNEYERREKNPGFVPLVRGVWGEEDVSSPGGPGATEGLVGYPARAVFGLATASAIEVGLCRWVGRRSSDMARDCLIQLPGMPAGG
jgi:hypothetical protein